jgi:hypothetical protein
VESLKNPYIARGLLYCGIRLELAGNSQILLTMGKVWAKTGKVKGPGAFVYYTYLSAL